MPIFSIVFWLIMGLTMAQIMLKMLGALMISSFSSISG